MYRNLRKHKSVGELVSGFALLALLSTGMSAIFCPHMAGSSHSCFVHESTTDAHEAHDQPEIRHEHSHLQPMSAMAEEIRGDDQPRSEVISQPDEPCPHCLNHSHVKADYTLKGSVHNGPSYEVVISDTSAQPVPARPSAVMLVDLHGHSPPGRNAERYILNSSLRI